MGLFPRPVSKSSGLQSEDSVRNAVSNEWRYSSNPFFGCDH